MLLEVVVGLEVIETLLFLFFLLESLLTQAFLVNGRTDARIYDFYLLADALIVVTLFLVDEYLEGAFKMGNSRIEVQYIQIQQS